MQIDLPTLQRFFAGAPFMADLGVEPTAVDEGRVETGLLLAPRHFQHTGQVHAGVMLSMADHSMGAAAQTLADAGCVAITAELSSRLLRAAVGQRLHCEARVIQRGRSLSFTEADVYCDDTGQRVHVMRAGATMALTRRG